MKYEEEIELVRKVKDGDLKAFEELVRSYQRRIYVAIYRMVHNVSDTEDLVQDTFIRAFHSIGSFNEKYHFSTWIYRIAMNLSINHLKKQTTKSVSLDSLPPRLVVDKTTNPVNKANESILKEKIKSALEQLPSEQKAVFILRTYEEFSYEEIARTLNISIGTVMSRLSRAREKLKEILIAQGVIQ